MTDTAPTNDKPTSLRSRIAGGVTAFVAICAVMGFMMFNSAQSVPLTPLVGMLPALNSAGDSVYNEMFISDSTGVVVTPNDAGVFTVVSGAPLTAGGTDGSDCITASITTGLFTIAKNCGTGRVLLTACVNLAAGSSNAAQATTGAWAQNGTALATSAASRLIKTEVVDAGNAYAPMGCAVATATAALDDTFGFYVTNPGGGLTATIKQANVRIQKIRN